MLWVFAAGNECRDARYQSPASLTAQFPDITLSVAATTSDGQLASYSNRGALVDLAAPGTAILSTANLVCSIETDCGETYGTLQGSSMAAPHVTGTAALMVAANPGLTAAEAHACLVDSTTDRPVAGQSFGILDAQGAVSRALGGSDAPAPSDPDDGAGGDDGDPRPEIMVTRDTGPGDRLETSIWSDTDCPRVATAEQPYYYLWWETYGSVAGGRSSLEWFPTWETVETTSDPRFNTQPDTREVTVRCYVGPADAQLEGPGANATMTLEYRPFDLTTTGGFPAPTVSPSPPHVDTPSTFTWRCPEPGTAETYLVGVQTEPPVQAADGSYSATGQFVDGGFGYVTVEAVCSCGEWSRLSRDHWRTTSTRLLHYLDDPS